jgi:hypothetical protein
MAQSVFLLHKLHSCASKSAALMGVAFAAGLVKWAVRVAAPKVIAPGTSQALSERFLRRVANSARLLPPSGRRLARP